MAAPTPLTAVEAKVWLLYLRPSRFPRLSLNIIREVCLYIRGRLILPVFMYSSSLYLFDLSAVNFSAIRLKQLLGTNLMYCLLDEYCVLGVEDRYAAQISLIDYAITLVNNTNVRRRWPGMAKIGNWVYVFGGNADLALKSTEKFSRKGANWENMNDMLEPKSCFTPCLVGKEFYLCCFSEQSRPFEAFNPATETFRALPVSYTSSLYGSVTFLIENTLYIVGNRDVLLKWKLNKASLEPETTLKAPFSGNLASTNIPPMSLGDKVYWVCCGNGSFVAFDKATDSIKVVAWLK